MTGYNSAPAPALEHLIHVVVVDGLVEDVVELVEELDGLSRCAENWEGGQFC